MAFLRQDTKKSGTYIRIVHSFRDENNKIRHNTLYNLGKVEDYNPEALKRIGQTLYELGGGLPSDLEHKSLHELARYYYGFPLIISKLLDIYSLDKFFDKITSNKDLGFSISKIVTLLICERFHDPVSKYASFKNQNDYIGLPAFSLHHIYRTLDQLCKAQEPLKTIIFNKGRNLFNQKLDVVFYDVTTFYFDSNKEDGFREKGFGKDGKIGKTIIVFGLLIDQNKQPVGYEVYKGRQWEGHTYREAVERLKKKYQIDKIICVADSGMMGSDNIKLIEEADYEYIIGERLKSLSKAIQDEILDISKYKILTFEDEDHHQINIQYYITDYKNKKLITTYSAKRAERDRALRQEKISKALEFIKNPTVLEKKAKHHFLKKENSETYALDQEKIMKSERFDGFKTIATNNKNLSVDQLLDAYKQLYRIEHSFRSFKTFLETRPMYHWTENRIRGHLALCYIAFTLLNYLQLQLKRNGYCQSENDIRRNLIRMQMSLITQNNNEYYLRSKTEEEAKQILKALQMREIPDLIPKANLNQYL
jgi:transposase